MTSARAAIAAATVGKAEADKRVEETRAKLEGEGGEIQKSLEEMDEAETSGSAGFLNAKLALKYPGKSWEEIKQKKRDEFAKIKSAADQARYFQDQQKARLDEATRNQDDLKNKERAALEDADRIGRERQSRLATRAAAQPFRSRIGAVGAELGAVTAAGAAAGEQAGNVHAAAGYFDEVRRKWIGQEEEHMGKGGPAPAFRGPEPSRDVQRALDALGVKWTEISVQNFSRVMQRILDMERKINAITAQNASQ
jgi:hypothetical protein